MPALILFSSPLLLAASLGVHCTFPLLVLTAHSFHQIGGEFFHFPGWWLFPSFPFQQCVVGLLVSNDLSS